jgi:hypothetical protein
VSIHAACRPSPCALELTAGDVGSVPVASNVTTISEDVNGICVGAEVVDAEVVDAVVAVARPRWHSSVPQVRQRSSEAAARRSDAANAFGNFAVQFLHTANVFVSVIFDEASRNALGVGADFLSADDRRHVHWR